MRNLLPSIVLCTVFLIYPLFAHAETISVGLNQSLEITFTMPPVSRIGLPPSDTAYLAFGSPTSGTATQATTSLFDGAILLGNSNSTIGLPSGFYFHWTNSGSSYNLPQATLIDATSLIDRSIQGRFVVTFNGDFNFERNAIYFGAGNGFNGTTQTEGGNAPILTGVSVVTVPEPETYALILAGGLGLLSVVGRKRLHQFRTI